MRGRPSLRKRVLDLVDDRLVVVVLQLLDVPLVPRLRPPALIVPARLCPRCGRRSPGAGHREARSTPLLAAHDGDDHAVPASEQRHERREQKVVRDPDVVGHRATAARARSRRCRARPRTRRARGHRPGRTRRRSSCASRSKSSFSPLGPRAPRSGRVAPCDFAARSSSEWTRVAIVAGRRRRRSDRDRVEADRAALLGPESRRARGGRRG